MKTISNIKPSTILDLGNNSYHYNYNIVEKEQLSSLEAEPSIIFEYNTVLCYGKPSQSDIIQYVIKSIYDESEELNLINRYNSYQLGVLVDTQYKTDYETFLSNIKNIKEMVKKDWNEYINNLNKM